MNSIRENIKELEEYIGFPIKRKVVTLEDEEPYDETFSYGLSQKFYGNKQELKRLTVISNEILVSANGNQNNEQIGKQKLSNLYSFAGNIYYLLGDYQTSLGYFAKSIITYPEDITPWFELIFNLRSLREFSLFETVQLNFGKVIYAYRGKNGHIDNFEDLHKFLTKFTDKANKNHINRIENWKRLNSELLNIGNLCNNNCICCPNDLNDKTHKVPFPVIIERIRKLDSNCTDIILTGGEPTIREDIFDILEAIKKTHPKKRIQILTNGRRFSYISFARKILKFNIFPTISLYGNREVHNQITRTKASYDQTIEGIQNLLSLNCRIRIIIVVNKKNYKVLPEMISLLNNLKSKSEKIHVIIQPTEYTGYSAKRFMEELDESVTKMSPEINLAIERLNNNEIDYSFNFPLCILQNYILTQNKPSIGEFDRIYYSDKCKFCVLNSKCGRIWKSYTDLRGDDEIRRVSVSDIKQWVRNTIRDLLKITFDKNKIDFISLVRLFYGEKECARINTDYFTSRKIARISQFIGYHSTVIFAGFTKFARSTDRMESESEFNMHLQRLKKENIFSESEKLKKVLDLKRNTIKKITLKNIQNNVNQKRTNLGQSNYYIQNKYFCYICKKKDYLIKLVNSEIKDGNNSGIFYGYPNCCINAYKETDLLKHIKHITKTSSQIRVDYHLNFLSQLNPLIEHYPCSWECKHSVANARKTEKLIQKNFPEMLDYMLDRLKCRLICTEKHIIVDNLNLENNCNYKDTSLGFKNILIWPSEEYFVGLGKDGKKVILKDKFSNHIEEELIADIIFE